MVPTDIGLNVYTKAYEVSETVTGLLLSWYPGYVILRVWGPYITEGIVRGVTPLFVPSRYTEAPDGVEPTDIGVVVPTGVGVKVYT
ncbi:MAG: hypothetical protein WCK53_15020 [Methanomicrobiales archaeon]